MVTSVDKSLHSGCSQRMAILLLSCIAVFIPVAKLGGKPVPIQVFLEDT